MKQKYLSDFPEIFKEFDVSKNIGLNPYDFKKGTNKRVWWKCDKGHEWQSFVNHRTNGSKCPFCCGRMATKENNLLIKRPDLASEWHPYKNILSPIDYLQSSGKKVWWKCKEGHEWEATIDHRNHGRGCPFCKGKKVTSTRNLAAIFPAIAAEWHPTKNLPLTPETAMPVSPKIVWWQCLHGHEYEAKICERTSGNKQCFLCNTLAVKRPEIAAQWHLTKNGQLTPSDVYSVMDKKVFWQCNKFENHFWEASICSRTGWKNSGCPMCRISKSEEDIKNILEKMGINYKRELKFDNCKSKRLLPFDFAVFPNKKMMGLIEFQGEQHYKDIPYWGGNDKLSKIQKNDSIKKSFCEEQSIPLLVIPYTDKNEMEKLITEFVAAID